LAAVVIGAAGGDVCGEGACGVDACGVDTCGGVDACGADGFAVDACASARGAACANVSVAVSTIKSGLKKIFFMRKNLAPGEEELP